MSFLLLKFDLIKLIAATTVSQLDLGLFRLILQPSKQEVIVQSALKLVFNVSKD